MAFGIAGLRAPIGDEMYYNAAFRSLIEDHRIHLMTGAGMHMEVIPDGDALRWRYDFYGLLTAMGVPRHLHWIYLRVNDMVSPTQFNSGMTTIVIPNLKTIEQLMSVYLTTLAG